MQGRWSWVLYLLRSKFWTASTATDYVIPIRFNVNSIMYTNMERSKLYNLYLMHITYVKYDVMMEAGA